MSENTACSCRFCCCCFCLVLKGRRGICTRLAALAAIHCADDIKAESETKQTAKPGWDLNRVLQPQHSCTPCSPAGHRHMHMSTNPPPSTSARTYSSSFNATSHSCQGNMQKRSRTPRMPSHGLSHGEWHTSHPSARLPAVASQHAALFCLLS